MKKSLFALAMTGVAIGAAAVCVTGAVAAISAIVYDKIEEAKAERAGIERAAMRARLAQLAAKVTKKEEESDDSCEICYYAERGRVYHMNRNCRHIADNENVVMATVDQAQEAGKVRKCALCGE